MRNLIPTLCASALAFGAAGAQAAYADTIYYSGSFSCGASRYVTDWKIGKGPDGAISAVVYYQNPRGSQVQWLDLHERATPQGNVLLDANGNPRLAVSAEGKTISASWLTGAPDADCSQFTVARAESPRARFDALFALMETPEPDAEVAARVEEMTRQVPIEFALPELDQTSYMRRYQEGIAAFWTRYREKLLAEFSAMPTATPEGRKHFAERLNAVLSHPRGLVTERDGVGALAGLLRQSADRIAETGTAPADLLQVRDAAEVCRRFTALQDSSIGFDLDKLEIANGVPFDYWTRDLAESYLASAPGCAAMPEDYPRNLVSRWPSIQSRQELIAALRKEQARLIALPPTAATLVETRNLKPNLEGISIGWGQSDLVDRFFGKALDARRTAVFDGAVAEIEAIAAAYQTGTPETAGKLGAICDSLRYLPGLDNDRTSTIRQTCETAQETMAAKQSAAALEKIEAAFAKAEPGSEAAKAAEKLCGTLPSELSGSAAMAVYDACREKQAALKAREAELRCQSAIQASGAAQDLLDSTIAVAERKGSSTVSVRDLICKVAEREMTATFQTSGMLMWTTQTMMLGHPRREKPAQLILTPVEDGEADWTITVEDEETRAELDKEGMRPDMISACLTGSSGCYR